MECHISFRPYRRPFARPLRTAHGDWSMREGFIVRVQHDLDTVYGEVAPIPEFGTETLESAEAYLRSLKATGSLSVNTMDPDTLPCCAFGISAALSGIRPVTARDYSVAALLPAGRAALNAATVKTRLGYTMFKWKIGVESATTEQGILAELMQSMPANAQIRLDANGGLSVDTMENWLEYLHKYWLQIDYLEQPLSPGYEALMADYAKSSRVPIALDESLHGTEGAQWLEVGKWQGPLVIKPALMGDCDSLIERLRPVAGQVVISSVFETAIGLENVLNIADRLTGMTRAIGFDTLDAFSDNLMTLKAGPSINSTDRSMVTPADLWDRLSPNAGL